MVSKPYTWKSMYLVAAAHKYKAAIFFAFEINFLLTRFPPSLHQDFSKITPGGYTMKYSEDFWQSM